MGDGEITTDPHIFAHVNTERPDGRCSELKMHTSELISDSHQYVKVEVKVKCTLVQALRLCTGRTAHRRNRGIDLLFLDHGTRRK